MRKLTFCKAVLAAALLSTGAMQAAQADIVTFTGSTTGAPVYNRLDLLEPVLSDFGTAVNYRAYSVHVSQDAADYSFVASCSYDCFVFLYQNTFDPANPVANVLGASDDLLNYQTAGFAGYLSSGSNYVFVVTAYQNGDAGNFSTTIAGSGNIMVAAIPEPSTYMMLGVGLAAIGLYKRRRTSISKQRRPQNTASES